MSRRGVLFGIIILIIVILIIVISVRAPALLLTWRHTETWCDADVAHSLFTKSESAQIESKILTHPQQVRRVNSVLGVIGTAAYIDGGPTYRERAALTNSRMRGEYKKMYSKLRSHLEDRIGEKVVYAMDRDAGISLPGFHLFNGDSPLGRGWAVASLHADMQETRIIWPTTDRFDMTKTLSFTIPISIPKRAGVGLYILKKRSADVNRLLPLWWTLRHAKTQKIDYEEGNCYLHHGKWFHMISPYNAKREDGGYADRITLQGHAIWCESRSEWWLYW